MKILTLSLHSYQELNQHDKFKKIAEEIVQRDIDIVCFTEAAQRMDTDIVNGIVRQDNALEYILRYIGELKPNHTYRYTWAFSHYGFHIYEEGLAVLSKYPIIKEEQRYVSQTSDPFTFKSRNILKTEIDCHGRIVDVYCCHLGWQNDEYEPFSLHFKHLDQWVKESSHQALLAGNFGNDVTSSCYDQIMDASYRDCYVEAKPEGYYDETFSSFSYYVQDAVMERHRIDYVFANEAFTLKATDAQLLFKEDRVSDHYGVYVEFDE